MVSPHSTSQTTISPIALSPDTPYSLITDISSCSLPATLSPLQADVDPEIVSPVSVTTSRHPSSPHTRYPTQHFPTHSSSHLATRLSHNNLRVHTAHTTRSAPISRKPSVGSLDRDASFHLDMKRLLSKPAQSLSGSSVVSVPSDPEISSRASHSPRHPRSFSHQAHSSRSLGGSSPVRRATDDPIFHKAVSTIPQFTQTLSMKPPASKASLPNTVARESSTSHSQRNVLRRKSSARSNPSTPTASTFKTAPVEVSARPQFSRTQRPNGPRRAASATATADPVSVASLRRNKEPPPHLTPAGAVVHAYKQQEQRREQLAEMSGSNEQLRQQRDVTGIPSSSRREMQDYDDEGEGGIYYTVFGGSVGKVVAVGSAEDSSWNVSFDSRYVQELRSKSSTREDASASAPASIPSRLGRKISGRFKKASGGIIRHGRDQSPQDGLGSAYRQPDEPYDGRPSLCEKRAAATPSVHTTTASARGHSISTDGFVDIRLGFSVPTAQNGSAEKTDSERRGKEGKVLRSVKSVIGKEKESDKDSSPAGKLQKLIKRFSSGGGLRDRYTREAPAPPVPALPKDFQQVTPSRMTLDISKPSGRMSPFETNLTRFPQTRISASGMRPSTAPHHGTPRKDSPGSRPGTGPRPSTTTRSSSPMSSDIASTRFFTKSHSTRSSISSYGAELPPLPTAFAQHILSPGELSKLNKESEDELSKRKSSRARTRSVSREGPPVADADVRPSLPPPRRQDSHRPSPSPADSFPPSPTTPSFGVDDPMNNFSLFQSSSLSRLSLPTSEFGVSDDAVIVPPRPRRSSRRKAPPPELIASPTSSTPLSPPVPTTPCTPRSPNIPKLKVNVTPSSVSAASTPYSASASQEGSSTSSSARSPIRFRDFESPRAHLTEAEKKAKWDDLLFRSDQAGGTLRVGEPGLMSDAVRFSDYSEI
ncbi:hypothetical protein BC835DRAFT_1418473 [Cytidiella melzeri]|nr:hypothetical protein BC835DRAFT_1418473 [Cytidiella melzeri]